MRELVCHCLTVVLKADTLALSMIPYQLATGKLAPDTAIGLHPEGAE